MPSASAYPKRGGHLGDSPGNILVGRRRLRRRITHREITCKSFAECLRFRGLTDDLTEMERWRKKAREREQGTTETGSSARPGSTQVSGRLYRVSILRAVRTHQTNKIVRKWIRAPMRFEYKRYKEEVAELGKRTRCFQTGSWSDHLGITTSENQKKARIFR